MAEVEQPASPDSEPVVNTTTSETSTEERDFDPQTGELLTQEPPVEDDEAEDEIEGVKLKGKKEYLERIKSERLMHADYTRKTQEVAEQRRTFEAERQQFQQTAQAHQEHLREVAKLVAVDERLQQFAQVNWQSWADQDPVAAQKAHIEFTQLQAQRGQLAGTLAQKNQQRQLAMQQESARQANEAEAVVMRTLKDWGPAKYQELQEFAKTEAGIEPESLRRMLVNVPQSAKILQLALVQSRLQKQRAAKPAAEPEKPATRLSGAAAPVRKTPDAMTDAEFAAWRKRQIAQRS